MKKYLSLFMALCMLLGCALAFSACGDEKEDIGYMNDIDLDNDGKDDIGTEPVSVVISVLHFGEITVELLPEYAPITVCNFLDLVDSKFYDGLTFHRVSKGFMIQGGDPKGDGSGGSSRKIKGEYTGNGVYNPLSHTRGTISMARHGNDMNSASSQFFICDADSTFLDGQYAAFGKVTDGMDVVDKIADVAVTYSANGEKSVPINTITIENIRRVEESKEDKTTDGSTDHLPDGSKVPAVDDPAATFLKTDLYNDFVLTDNCEPYYVGRWFEKEIDGESHMVTLNDGSVIYFMTKGAEYVTLDFTVITGNDVPYFAYSIDGCSPVRQKVNDSIVELPDDGYHIIRIVTDGLTESVGKWDYERGFALKEIGVSNGGEIIGIKPTDKTIFFYGDSITEGISALGGGWNTEVNSATNAYSWICAKQLHAVPYIVGYGGSGLIRTGSFNTMLNAISYFAKNRPVEGEPTPDLIVINHGHNDGPESAEDFRMALLTTLKSLATRYPGVPIVYVVPFNQAHASVIQQTVPTMGSSFYVVSTAGWNIETTDGAHPSVNGANNAGTRLAAELKRIFGEDFFA